MGRFKNRKKREVEEATKEKSRWDISLTKMAKRELIITLISILGVTTLSLGSAFAIFTTQNESDYHVIKVGTLNIDFGQDANNTIDLNGQYPKSDALGLSSTPYNFTIENTGSLPARFEVSIEDDLEMIEQDACTSKQLNKEYIKYSLDGTSVSTISALAINNYKIDTGVLDPGAAKTYTIRVWISETAGNDALNKHYHGKIVVNAVNDTDDSVMKKDFLAGNVEKEKITSIITKADVNVPSTAIKSWDASESRNSNVVVYIEDDGLATNTYRLTIGGKEEIIAPVDSSNLFDGFINATTMNLTAFNTSSVMNMEAMFNKCENLVSIDISSFDTSQVENMISMFSYCEKLSELDLGNFNTEKVTSMNNMFIYCSKLTSITVGDKWIIGDSTNIEGMFTNCGVDHVTVLQ